MPGHDPVHDLIEAQVAGVQFGGILGPAERGHGPGAVGQIAALDPAFVTRLVGCDLVRIRARTVYYVLERIQECCRGLENREG